MSNVRAKIFSMAKGVVSNIFSMAKGVVSKTVRISVLGPPSLLVVLSHITSSSHPLQTHISSYRCPLVVNLRIESDVSCNVGSTGPSNFFLILFSRSKNVPKVEI